MKKESVVAIIPVWKDETIIEVIKRFRPEYVDEIVIVLDEPSDKMIHQIKNANKAVTKKITILSNPIRKGIGFALRKGITYAKSKGHDIVVIMAGNGKDNPADIPKLVNKIKEGYDYVQGSRFLKGGSYYGLPLQRVIFNRLWPLFWSIITLKKQTEVTNGFRAYKLSILNEPNINLNQKWLDGYALEYYIHYKVLTNRKYLTTEVPVSKIYKSRKNYTKIKPMKDWYQIILPPLLLLFRIRK